MHLPVFRRLPYYAIASLLLGGSWIAYQNFELFQARVERLETSSIGGNHQKTALQLGLADLRRELGGLEREAERLEAQAQQTTGLQRRIAELEQSLSDFQLALACQNSDFEELRQLHGTLDSSPVTQRLSELEHALLSGREALNELVSTALDTGKRAEKRLSEIENREATQHDLDRRWQDLMGPTVQISGENSVGSGVLLASRPADDGGYDNYLLTAWHVVRDIQGDLEHLDMLVPVTIYSRDGATRLVHARVVQFDVEVDATLLLLDVREALEVGAGLASREALGKAVVFQGIYAVGCPLGNDPIPTLGEISSVQHEVDGKCYWMINAPTFIGNSGGGIFDAQTHELLGIFSKIYNYGSSRPTVVPHMGLVVPLTKVYDWLDGVGYGHLAGAPAARPVAASAPR